MCDRAMNKKNKTIISLYHDVSTARRICNAGKQERIHGHNFRVHFFCDSTDGDLDDIGKLADRDIIKNRLCKWLDKNWDYRLLVWNNDLVSRHLVEIDSESVVWTNFNPTTEKMAEYLVEEIGPNVLKGTFVELIKVVIEETRNCSVEYEKIK